jgi:pilus assembly protein Flp/PilA
MKAMILRARRFLACEDGPAAVEYAVMLALIVAVSVAVIQALGASTIGSFGAFGGAMSAAGSGS